MVSFFHALKALGLFYVVASALPSSSTPIPPSKDPFYTAPAGYEAAKPGSILRLRAAPGNLTSAVGNCSAAYHVLYRTTDARFRPSWALTTLYVPKNSSGKALLSYQFPYNTPDVDHSPSYDFQFAAPTDIGTALGLGWLVNVPDHEGPFAADGANVGQGYATLDSVRAALSPQFGLTKDVKYAMWGYSGGALASEWAAELQVQYAPELHFSGMALGGTPQNITSVWEEANRTPYSGMIPLASVGVTKLYPEAYDYLVNQLKPEGAQNRSTYMSVLGMSFNEAFAAFANQNMWDYFIDGEAILDAPLIQKVLDSNFYMGYHGVPQMPVFAYHAVHDQLALIEKAEALFERFCGVHTSILLERNAIGDHITELTNSAPRAVEWLSSIFDGTYVPKGCAVKDVSRGVAE